MLSPMNVSISDQNFPGSAETGPFAILNALVSTSSGLGLKSLLKRTSELEQSKKKRVAILLILKDLQDHGLVEQIPPQQHNNRARGGVIWKPTQRGRNYLQRLTRRRSSMPGKYVETSLDDAIKVSGWERLREAFRDGRVRTQVNAQLEAWNKVDWSNVPEETALKWEFDMDTKQWENKKEITVKIHPNSFAKGGMRQCFRMKKIDSSFTGQNWSHASPYVAKRYLDSEVGDRDDGKAYKDDVRLHIECMEWAEKYNACRPPKRVEFMNAWLIQIPNRDGSPYFHVERYIVGDYVKYNSNAGFVQVGDEAGASGHLRATPQAFSHYTYEVSGKQKMVVDMQGVQDFFTDPQIHSYCKEYGGGDLGALGFAHFFRSHICNSLHC
eukprot:m.39318 g.39318  ORF g.39318 m.39318 type:complete len:383 (-) comp9535_c0_seq1:1372-2520(-)